MMYGAATPATAPFIHSRRVIRPFMNNLILRRCLDELRGPGGSFSRLRNRYNPSRVLMRYLDNSHRLFLLAILILGTSLGQQPTARITGIITDASGAVIPNARITAANIDTGVETATESNDSGNYVFSSLPVGTYSLSVQKSGFSRVERRDI